MATASIWGEAGRAQCPCLLLGILTKPSSGWLGVPAVTGLGLGQGLSCCTFCRPGSLVGAQAETSSIQIDQEAF